MIILIYHLITRAHGIIVKYPTRANGIIVLVNSQTGFCRRFLFPQFYKAKNFKLGALFSNDVKLRLLAHSQSFLANQKARNAIVGAENLLIKIIQIYEPYDGSALIWIR